MEVRIYRDTMPTDGRRYTVAPTPILPHGHGGWHARYDGWSGAEIIGPPRERASEAWADVATHDRAARDAWSMSHIDGGINYRPGARARALLAHRRDPDASIYGVVTPHTIEICEDCLLMLANGEYPPDRVTPREHHATRHARRHTPRRQRPGVSIHLGPREPEPLALIGGTDDINPGAGSDWHDEKGCDVNRTMDDCDCETVDFSMSPCEGCGTGFHGRRHAATLWAGVRRPTSRLQSLDPDHLP